jgi:hypothetical protein
MAAWVAHDNMSPKPKIRNVNKLRTKYLKKNGNCLNRQQKAKVVIKRQNQGPESVAAGRCQAP